VPASTPVELGATQAMPIADVAAELATPVAPYIVPQSAPVSIVPSPIVPSWHVADAAAAFPTGGPATSAPAADPFLASRRVHAAPAQPVRRPKKSSRGRSADRSADRTTSGRAPANRRAVDDGKPIRQRLFGVGVMVLVGGLFAVLAIPAYADNDAATLKAATAVQTQKVAVANVAASTITTTARDGYTATSAADLKSLYAAAMRQQNIEAYLQSGAKAKGDDYPWFAELSRNQGGGLSPLGYYYRECVDFVAWRLNRDAGSTSAPFKWTWSNLTPNGGDGHQWKAAWLAHGWATGSTPKPGAVAWFGDNHVGYVNGILDNGQVLIEEYNYVPHAYGTRVINPDQAYYLYAPPA
jgi:surface antigen